MAYTITPLVPQSPSPLAQLASAQASNLGAQPTALQGVVEPFGLTPNMGTLGSQYVPTGQALGPPPKHGFLQNLESDIGGFVSGIGQMIGAGGHDVVKGVQELLSGGRANNDPWMTGEIVKGLPRILDYYNENYVQPIVHGQFSKLGTFAYEHPLQFALDVLWGTDAAAKSISKMGLHYMPETTAARSALLEAQKLRDPAKIAEAQSTLEAALVKETPKVPQWIRAVAPGVGTEYPGGARVIMAGNEPMTVGRGVNPLRRALFERPWERLTTEPLADVQARYQAMTMPLFKDGQPVLGEDGRQVRIAVSPLEEGKVSQMHWGLQQAEKAGVTRLEKSRAYNWRLRWLSDRVFGTHSASHIEQRQRMEGELSDMMRYADAEQKGHLADWTVGLGPDTVTSAKRYMSSGSTTSIGLNMDPEEAAQMFSTGAARVHQVPAGVPRRVVPEKPLPEELAASTRAKEAVTRFLQGGRTVQDYQAAVTANTGLVRNVLKKMGRGGMDYADLFQQGMLEVMDALRKFDPEGGVAWSNWAYNEVRNGLSNYIRDQSMVGLRSLVQALPQTIYGMSADLGRMPTIPELAAELGSTPMDVAAAMGQRGFSPLLRAAESGGQDLGRMWTQGDVEQALARAHPEGGGGTREMGTIETRDALVRLVRQLPENAQMVLTMRYLGDMSTAEVAQEMGMSQRYVQMVEARALKRWMDRKGHLLTEWQQGAVPNPDSIFQVQQKQARDIRLTNQAYEADVEARRLFGMVKSTPSGLPMQAAGASVRGTGADVVPLRDALEHAARIGELPEGAYRYIGEKYRQEGAAVREAQAALRARTTAGTRFSGAQRTLLAGLSPEALQGMSTEELRALSARVGGRETMPMVKFFEDFTPEEIAKIRQAGAVQDWRFQVVERSSGYAVQFNDGLKSKPSWRTMGARTAPHGENALVFPTRAEAEQFMADAKAKLSKAKMLERIQGTAARAGGMEAQVEARLRQGMDIEGQFAREQFQPRTRSELIASIMGAKSAAEREGQLGPALFEQRPVDPSLAQAAKGLRTEQLHQGLDRANEQLSRADLSPEQRDRYVRLGQAVLNELRDRGVTLPLGKYDPMLTGALSPEDLVPGPEGTRLQDFAGGSMAEFPGGFGEDWAMGGAWEGGPPGGVRLNESDRQLVSDIPTPSGPAPEVPAPGVRVVNTLGGTNVEGYTLHSQRPEGAGPWVIRHYGTEVGRAPTYSEAIDAVRSHRDAFERSMLKDQGSELYPPDIRGMDPWTTTRSAYIKDAVARGRSPAWAEAEHGLQVRAALMRSERVPFYVLADYPALPGGQRALFMRRFLSALTNTRVTPLEADWALFLHDKVAQAGVKLGRWGSVDEFYSTHVPMAMDTEGTVLGRFNSQSHPIRDSATGRIIGSSIGGLTFYSPGADFETVTHELLHAVRNALPTEDLVRLEQHYGLWDGAWSEGKLSGTAADGESFHMGKDISEMSDQERRMLYQYKKAEEQFVHDGLTYLVEEAPPSTALHPTMRTIKEALARVWYNLRGLSIKGSRYDKWMAEQVAKGQPLHGIDIPALTDPKLRKVFDQWFGPADTDTMAGRANAAGFANIKDAAKATGALAGGLIKPDHPLARKVMRLSVWDRADLIGKELPIGPTLPKTDGQLLTQLRPENRNGIEWLNDERPPVEDTIPNPAYEDTLAGHQFPIDLGRLDGPPLAEALPARSPEQLLATRRMARQVLEPLVGRGSVRDFRPNDPGDLFFDSPHAQAVADLIISDWKQLPRARQALDQLGTVVGIAPYTAHAHDLGYRATHIDVFTRDGTLVQFRIQTPRSLAATKAALPALVIHNKHLEDIKQLMAVTTRTADQEAVLAQMTANVPYEEAYVRSLFEPAVQELRRDIEGHAPSQVEMMGENLRTWVQSRLTNRLLGSSYGPDKLDGLRQLFERQYLPLRYWSGAEWDAAKGTFVGGEDALRIHRLRQMAGQWTPLYFPMQKLTELLPGDFLMPKTERAARPIARGRYLNRATGALLENGMYATDPQQVFMRRASQAIRMAETYDMVENIIARFARPVPFRSDGSPDLAMVAPGESLFAPDDIYKMFRAQIGLGDWLSHLKAGVGDDAEILDALVARIQPFIQGETMSFTGLSTKGVKVYAIPRVVARRLRAQVQPEFFRRPFVRFFFDKPTAFWRRVVLSGSPRWVVNNLIGNISFIKLQGARVSDVVRTYMPSYQRALADLEDRLGTSVFPEEVRSTFYSPTQTYNTRLGTAADEYPQLTRIANRLADTTLSKWAVAMSDRVRNLNENIETHFRQASYLSASQRELEKVGALRNVHQFWRSGDLLEQAASVGADPVLARRALDAMNYWMNDYRRMSPETRHFLRPYIFPFWSFYRHIGKLLLTMPYEHPGRMAMAMRLTDITNELASGYGQLPDFLMGAVALGPGSQPGDTKFLSTAGPNPFNVVFQNIPSLLHPYWKTVLEEATGRTAYSNFKTEFTSPNVISPFGADQKYKVDREGHIEPVGKVRPPIIEELMRQFPQYQTLENVVSGGQTYDTATLPAIIRDRLSGYPPTGVIKATADVSKGTPGQPLYPLDPVQQVARLLGFSTIDYAVGPYQQRNAENAYQALLDYYRRLGIVPPADQAQSTAAVPATQPGLVPIGFGG